MGHTTSPDVTFADWLRDQLKERGWGIRTLARKIDPGNYEVPRRALNRYMRGARPTEHYAQAIADAFGVDRDTIPLSQEAALSGGTFRNGDADDVRASGSGRSSGSRSGGTPGADEVAA